MVVYEALKYGLGDVWAYGLEGPPIRPPTLIYTREEKETLVDHAPIVTDTTSAKVLEAAEPILKAQEIAAVKELTPDIEDVKPIIVPLRERELSADDFSELKVAIEKLGKVKSEVDTVDDIKKELEEYQPGKADRESRSPACALNEFWFNE